MSFQVFERIDQTKAEQIVNAASTDDWTPNICFYNGDHWQNMNAYIGPRLPEGHEDFDKTMVRIRAGYVSQNVIKEISERHLSGVLGEPVQWSFVPRRELGKDAQGNDEEPAPDEQDQIDDADMLFKAWTKKRLPCLLSDGDDEENESDYVTIAALYSLLSRRGMLRVFIPPDVLPEDADGNVELPQELDIEAAFDLIHIHALTPAESTMFCWRDSQQHAGIYTYMDTDPFSLTANETREQRRAEVVYLNDDNETIIRLVNDDSDSDSDQSIVMDLGGQLTMYQIRRPLFITEQVRSQQKALNLAHTMCARSIVRGGFPQTIFLNADEPDELKMGAGIATFVQGVEITNEATDTSTNMPADVKWKDPTPVETFVDTKNLVYESMLEEAHQRHVLMSGDATSSGTSRITAMADFEIDLQKTAGAINPAYEWLMSVVITMAAGMANDSKRFSLIKPQAQAIVDPGPLTPEEMKALSELVQQPKPVMSQETGMRRVGVRDVDAEKGQISEEQNAEETRRDTSLGTALLNARDRFRGGGEGQ